MKFTFHNRRHPCPVCGSTSSKCRTTPDDLVLCMTAPDGAIAADGLHYVKTSNNGLWGIYAPGDRPSRLTDEERERRQQARAQRQQQAQTAFESGLPISERDREFRHLLAQLDLAPDHREQLRARGLSDEQIVTGAFRTVAPGQPIDASGQLPGIQGGRLAVSGRGLLCPARDRHGRILGAQVRLDTAESGRYRWLKGDRPSHLQSGELPLTVARPPSEPAGIALLEGLLKPVVAANRHGYACLGAAGGLFNSSPEQFRVNLDHLAQQLGTTTVHFPVDAGGRANRHVYRRDCQTIRQLQDWGYRVLVGDWGQWDDKAAGDWDEIPAGTPVSWCDAADYLPSHRQFLESLLGQLQGPARPQPRGFAPTATPAAPTPAPAAPSAPQHYAAGDRRATWQRSGQFVLDTSPTGTGKSHDAGAIDLATSGASGAVYITADPRNATTDTLKDWAVLEGRHNGLRRDDRDRLRRVQPGEPYEQRANCGRTGAIAALRAKGVDRADRADLICQSCAHFEGCKAGRVYGYLGQRQDTLTRAKFVSHPAALPDTSHYNYSDRLLIWDEASTIFSASQQTTASRRDLREAIAALALKAPREFARLQPWLAALDQLASGEQPRYGYSHRDLLAKLPPLPADLDWAALEQAIAPNLDAALNPYHGQGLDVEDLAALRQHEDKAVRQSARQLMKADTDRDTAQRIQDEVLNQWLLPAIAALSGRGGYVSLHYGTLTITTPNPRLVEIARAAQQNLFLDATGSAEELAQLLGVSPEAIACVAVETPETADLRLVQVTGLGRLGMQRGNFQQQQVKAVLAELGDRHPDLLAVDFKKHAQPGYLRWFVESRGVNDAENASAIALVGTPCPNLEALAADFAIRFGRIPQGETDAEFQAFVRRRILAELQQGSGRLRANRRPGESLTVYFLTDYELPFATEQVAAAEITPEAMSKRERFAAAVKQAIATLSDRGEAVNQSSVGRLVNYSRQYVSRLWGWVQQTLMGTPEAKVAPPQPPPEEVQVSAEILATVAETDPGGLTEAVFDVFLVWLKPPDWRTCWNLLSNSVQQAVLARLLLIPDGWLDVTPIAMRC